MQLLICIVNLYLHTQKNDKLAQQQQQIIDAKIFRSTDVTITTTAVSLNQVKAAINEKQKQKIVLHSFRFIEKNF